MYACLVYMCAASHPVLSPTATTVSAISSQLSSFIILFLSQPSALHMCFLSLPSPVAGLWMLSRCLFFCSNPPPCISIPQSSSMDRVSAEAWWESSSVGAVFFLASRRVHSFRQFERGGGVKMWSLGWGDCSVLLHQQKPPLQGWKSLLSVQVRRIIQSWCNMQWIMHTSQFRLYFKVR